jgi:hypothetical protein
MRKLTFVKSLEFVEDNAAKLVVQETWHREGTLKDGGLVSVEPPGDFPGLPIVDSSRLLAFVR